jgi:hypothetical protein
VPSNPRFYLTSILFNCVVAAFRDFSEVKNQEAVEELPHGTGLGGAGAQSGQAFPIRFRERVHQGARFGGEFAFGNIRGKAQGGKKFEFERENGARSGWLPGKRVEEAEK